MITGASAGIGAALARQLAEGGWDLVLGARRLDRLESLAAELHAAHGRRVLAVPLDVRDGASLDAFALQAEAFAGSRGVTALVNSAGLARGAGRLPDATAADEAEWEEVFDINVLGLLRVTRRFLPGMRQRGVGHVLNMGSLAGIETYEGGAIYCASKSAVRVISRALRLELIGSGLRVCCINPGMVETEFSEVRFGDTEAAKAVYQGMTPLTGDDVARACMWVLTQPPHTNIEELWLQPTDQASAQKVHRE
ncbi:MAG: oxidoreductase [Planctomycetota bacterium]|nr:MAG: oxidoreductase [Planctomycetota bacterium]